MKRRHTNTVHVLGVVFCVAVLTAPLAGCGSRAAGSAPATASGPGPAGGQATPGPAIAEPAKREACFVNERTVETQASAWTAQNPGTQPAASVQAMVDAGILRSVPSCPSGGTYSYDAGSGRLTCSVHGHF